MYKEKERDPAWAFLAGYWEARKESERLERRIEELESQATSMTANMSGMPRGGGGKSNSVWDALVDARERAGENLKKALELEAGIETFIAGLEGPQYRQLLRYRYLELLTWERIAEEMDYHERHVRKLHGKALQEARRVWALSHPDDYKEEFAS